jgi:hypothetical protein
MSSSVLEKNIHTILSVASPFVRVPKILRPTCMMLTSPHTHARLRSFKCFIWIIRVNWSYVFGPWSQSLLVATAVQTAGGFLTWRKLWDDSNMLRKRPIFHPCFWTSMHFDLMFYMLCLSMGYTVYCPKLYGEKRCGCMTSVQCSDLFVDFDQHYQPSWAFKAFKQQINMEKQLMI